MEFSADGASVVRWGGPVRAGLGLPRAGAYAVPGSSDEALRARRRAACPLPRG